MEAVPITASRTRGSTGTIPARATPDQPDARLVATKRLIQLPAMPVVPKQLPTIDGPGKIMPTPQGPIGSFGPPASDPQHYRTDRFAIEAFINRPITFIDAGGRAFQAYLGDTPPCEDPSG